MVEVLLSSIRYADQDTFVTFGIKAACLEPSAITVRVSGMGDPSQNAKEAFKALHEVATSLAAHTAGELVLENP